jgi:hypothetical protein
MHPITDARVDRHYGELLLSSRRQSRLELALQLSQQVCQLGLDFGQVPGVRLSFSRPDCGGPAPCYHGEYVRRIGPDPTGLRRGVTMLRGFATINYWAADLAAAKDWYSELLGIEPYFERADQPDRVGVLADSPLGRAS